MPKREEKTQEAQSHGTGGGSLGGTVGNGADWFAQLSGTALYQATGSFPSVVGATSSNAYSIQLNTNLFPVAGSISACGRSSGCSGWQQAIYSSSAQQSGLYFQYWLIGYGSSCPSGWQSSGGSCFRNSPGVSGVPLVSIGDLSTMTVKVLAGSSDTVTMTIAGSAYSASFSSVLGLNSGGWNLVEYGLFGDLGGSNVNVSSNTSVVTQINTEPPGNTPACSPNANESTAETNSLSLVPNCCLASSFGTQPGIEFEQSNVPGQACSVCGNEGQLCCTSVKSGWCASASDVCYGGTCEHCGDNDEPCCAGNTCTGAGVVCQLGVCGAPDVLVASPSSLSVTAGDGSTGANSAVTNFDASGWWANNQSIAPSLVFTATGVPSGVSLPPPGTMPTGISWAITNDINPPTVRLTAATNTIPGTYTFAVTGTIGEYQATAQLTLTVGACQPLTCAAVGYACGTIDNECGVTLNCGSCPSGDSCVAGACTPTCNKYCPPPEFLNPYACQCESCPCGTIIVGGHRICAVCKP